MPITVDENKKNNTQKTNKNTRERLMSDDDIKSPKALDLNTKYVDD